jgi:hypothetical protein
MLLSKRAIVPCLVLVISWLWMATLTEYVFNPTDRPVYEKAWIPWIGLAGIVAAILCFVRLPIGGESPFIMLIWLVAYMVSVGIPAVDYARACFEHLTGKPRETNFGAFEFIERYAKYPAFLATFFGQLFITLLVSSELPERKNASKPGPGACST